MNPALEELISSASDLYWHNFIIFLRMASFTSLLPAFGNQRVPMRVRLAIAFAFTAVVSPAIELNSEITNFTEFFSLALSECLIGALLGVALRLFLFAVQTAGSIAAQSTSLAQILGGASVEPIPAMGYILTMAATTLAVILGLHIHAAEFMILSYEIFPITTLPQGNDLAWWGTRQVSNSFELAFSLAAPFIIVSILYNLALGVINKAMPQLMVAFVGAPLISGIGIFFLFLSAPVIAYVWTQEVFSFLKNPTGFDR